MIKKFGDDLKEVGDDLKEFAREEKQKILGENPHDKIKDELEHEEKAGEDFVPSTGLTSEGNTVVLQPDAIHNNDGGKADFAVVVHVELCYMIR